MARALLLAATLVCVAAATCVEDAGVANGVCTECAGDAYALADYCGECYQLDYVGGVCQCRSLGEIMGDTELECESSETDCDACERIPPSTPGVHARARTHAPLE